MMRQAVEEGNLVPLVKQDHGIPEAQTTAPHIQQEIERDVRRERFKSFKK